VWTHGVVRVEHLVPGEQFSAHMIMLSHVGCA
jgi:hypothetical protein